MKRFILLCAAALFVSACDPGGTETYRLAKKEKAKSSQDTEGNAAEEPSVVESMTVSGLDLWMLGEHETDGSEHRPTFRVHAESGEVDAQARYTLFRPRAVIYDEEDQEIVLTSDSGDLDQVSGKAHLRGDVLVESGELRFTMDEITWDNKTELAYTETGVRLTSETAVLTANGLVIDPKTSGIVMRDVSGTFDLGAMN